MTAVIDATDVTSAGPATRVAAVPSTTRPASRARTALAPVADRVSDPVTDLDRGSDGAGVFDGVTGGLHDGSAPGVAGPRVRHHPTVRRGRNGWWWSCPCGASGCRAGTRARWTMAYVQALAHATGAR